jgi:hypothetical protein
MKNKKLQNLTLLFLTLFSLASYVYINTASVQNSGSSQLQSDTEEEEMKDTNKEVMLPDVRMFKKLITKGKDLLPAS